MIVLKGVSEMKRNNWSQLKLIGLIVVTVTLLAAIQYRSVQATPGAPTCGGLPAPVTR